MRVRICPLPFNSPFVTSSSSMPRWPRWPSSWVSRSLMTTSLVISGQRESRINHPTCVSGFRDSVTNDELLEDRCVKERQRRSVPHFYRQAVDPTNQQNGGEPWWSAQPPVD